MCANNNRSDEALLVWLGLDDKAQWPDVAWGWLLLEYDYVAFGQVCLWV